MRPTAESLATAERINAGAFIEPHGRWDLYENALISSDGNNWIGGSRDTLINIEGGEMTGATYGLSSTRNETTIGKLKDS